MTIPVGILGSVICLLLSIVIHLLIKLVDKVSHLTTVTAVQNSDHKALKERVRNLEQSQAKLIRTGATA